MIHIDYITTSINVFFILNEITVPFIQIPRGLTARIAGFHPAGPGSTPGVGIKPFSNINELTIV